MKLGKMTVAVVFCLAVASCKGGATNSSESALSGASSWGGVFNAYVNGTLKDGAINIQYNGSGGGEFEVDDTTGPLGGSKNMTYTSDGTTAIVTSTECAGDTFRIQHNLQNGQATFDGALCGTNLTGGTAQLSK